MKQFFRSSLLSAVALLLIVTSVFAGSTIDRGQLDNLPPVGTINYYAYNGDYQAPNGSPLEIITEDSYNSSSGPDQGYYIYTPVPPNPPLPTWRIQVRNFDQILDPPAQGDPITMVFGGLRTKAGSLWYYTFS